MLNATLLEKHVADNSSHAGQPADYSFTAGTSDLPRSHASLWGIALGAENSDEYPHFVTPLQEAGVGWIRYFPEWRTIQPQRGVWNWAPADSFVEDVRAKGIHVAGFLAYFAPWASADGKGERLFPVGDMQYWRDYVSACLTRYKGKIRYWEVWNEVNSPAFNKSGTPADYANMVREASIIAHKIDPDIRIGIGCAAYDVHYLDQVIHHGASGCFDYVCVHPYNNIGHVNGSEASFLAMVPNLRKMLEANGQRDDIELWMSEIGKTTTKDPGQLALQAEMLVKSFVLGAAQGFQRICWFEAVGGLYGDGVHAILDSEYKPYPAYHALKAMTAALGREAKYIGWLNLTEGKTCGFVFECPGRAPALAIWAAGEGTSATLSFNETVEVSTLTGDKAALPARKDLALTSEPVFVEGIAASLLKEARLNAAKRFPWTPDYRSAPAVSVKLGAVNEEHGLRQGRNDPRTDGLTIPGIFRGQEYRSTDIGNKRPFIYFEVDPSYMGWGDHGAEITVVARRSRADQPALLALIYESATGYHEYGKRTAVPGLNTEMMFESNDFRAPEFWYLPPCDDWHEHTWKIRDAQFIQKWGWTFQLNVEPSSSDVWVKEVRVKRI